jgi:hypothetical protein
MPDTLLDPPPVVMFAFAYMSHALAVRRYMTDVRTQFSLPSSMREWGRLIMKRTDGQYAATQSLTYCKSTCTPLV